LFPWCSTLAESYEQYRIRGMVFEYRPMSGDALNSTNTALGKVMMVTQYNVNQPIFVTNAQIENYEFGMSCKPSEAMIHPIECKRVETPTSILDTRICANHATNDNATVIGQWPPLLPGSGPNAAGDLRLSDWGNYTIATYGNQQASCQIGELWVSYDIEFMKPKLSQGIDVADHYVLLPSSLNVANQSSPFGQINVAGAAAGAPFTPSSSSDMGTKVVSSGTGTSATNTITWPATFTGNVQVMWHVVVDSAVTNAVVDVAKIQATTTGTAAAGLGVGLLFSIETATGGTFQTSGRIYSTWKTATNATRKGNLIGSAWDTAERIGWEIEADGSAPKIAFYGGTTVVRGAALTAQLTMITHTAPGTPDYAIQDFVDVSLGAGWAFANHDEANSVLKVIANLQTRVAELEARLGSATGVNLFA